jgi:hypothetical protein
MTWNIFKRNSNDPFVNKFYRKYGFHLVSIPREKILLGDIYTRKGNNGQSLQYNGNIANLLDPKFEMPAGFDELMTDFNDTLSDSISANIGFDFLESFLNQLGIGSFGASIRGDFQSSKTKFIQFNFSPLTREYIDPYLVGNLLADTKIGYKIKNNAAFDHDREYYIVTAVVKTPSISIVAKGDNNQLVDINAQALESITGKVNISSKKLEDGKISFAGPKKLAIGVELFQLAYNPTSHQFSLDPTEEAYKVHEDNTTKTKKIIKRAIIGDPNNADISIDLN